VYRDLNWEFNFTLDPCPLNGIGGLQRSWKGERVFCNPPYGPGILKWLRKSREADLAVYLLPARTDTQWWHGWALKAEEVRFVRGRLKFGGAAHNAPFPSVILVFKNGQDAARGGSPCGSGQQCANRKNAMKL
jgi:site-specific DNA-methyltransferase (adenine-specific)